MITEYKWNLIQRAAQIVRNPHPDEIAIFALNGCQTAKDRFKHAYASLKDQGLYGMPQPVEGACRLPC